MMDPFSIFTHVSKQQQQQHELWNLGLPPGMATRSAKSLSQPLRCRGEPEEIVPLG